MGKTNDVVGSLFLLSCWPCVVLRVCANYSLLLYTMHSTITSTRWDDWTTQKEHNVLGQKQKKTKKSFHHHLTTFFPRQPINHSASASNNCKVLNMTNTRNVVVVTTLVQHNKTWKTNTQWNKRKQRFLLLFFLVIIVILHNWFLLTIPIYLLLSSSFSSCCMWMPHSALLLLFDYYYLIIIIIVWLLLLLLFSQLLSLSFVAFCFCFCRSNQVYNKQKCLNVCLNKEKSNKSVMMMRINTIASTVNWRNKSKHQTWSKNCTTATPLTKHNQMSPWSDHVGINCHSLQETWQRSRVLWSNARLCVVLRLYIAKRKPVRVLVRSVKNNVCWVNSKHNIITTIVFHTLYL